jgi:hypothetical protein
MSIIAGYAKKGEYYQGFGGDAAAIAVHVSVLLGGRRNRALGVRIMESLSLQQTRPSSTARG